ncbi:unnamed protein product [Ophioblennius macclurei]
MDAGAPDRSSFNSRWCLMWIIEFVWSHNMTDVLHGLGASFWPDLNLDLQSLSLEESWRLRVASAHVLAAVKRRDVSCFETAVGFLEATHRLLPSLVSAIKHMKILFGLKTLVVMRMLRDGRGTVETVSKINQFFPSKLPEYQNQCTQREMFLMRKNHMDFKALAQALALDKIRRQKYIEKKMEEHYGEHYAQKVEDRLLQYLHQLEAALPRDTHIDEILKKQTPVTEEEKLLLNVITSDSAAIAATLRKLLRCDVACCRTICQSPQDKDATISRLTTSVRDGNSSPKTRSESSRGQQAVPLDRDSVVPGGGGTQPKRKPENIRQFCSKHLRWVRTILQECPDDCPTVSPPLLPSSSSTASSQDLTPSDLVPGRSRSGDSAGVRPRSSLSGDGVASSAARPVDATSSSVGPDSTKRIKVSPSGSGMTEDPTSGQLETKDTPSTDGPPTGHDPSRLCSSGGPSSEEVPQEPGGFLIGGPPPSVDFSFYGTPDGGTSGWTGLRPHPSSFIDDPSPSVQSDQFTFSSIFTSDQTSLDCDLCHHLQLTSDSSSPSTRQTPGTEDSVPVQPDLKRRPGRKDASTSTKRSGEFKDERSSGKVSAEELPRSSGELSGSGSCRNRVVPSGQSPNVQLVSSTQQQQQALPGSNAPSNQTSDINVFASETCVAVPCPPSHRDHSVSKSQTSNHDNVPSVSHDPPGVNLPLSVLKPVVRLVDIRSYLLFKPNKASPSDSVRSSIDRTPSGWGSRPRRASRGKDSLCNRQKTRWDTKTPPESQAPPPIPRQVSKLSLKFRSGFSNTISRPTLTDNPNISGRPTAPPRRPPTRTRRNRKPPSNSAPLRLSLKSQASLLRSNMLQPYVRLTRLNVEEFPPPETEMEEDPESSFDPNELYSDSDSEEEPEPDPNYKPSFKKSRLLLEYENAKLAAIRESQMK